MGSTDLVVASSAVAVRDYPPLPGPTGERGKLLIHAASRAGEARRTVSRFVNADFRTATSASTVLD